jgi:hypothetical protein
MMLRGRGWSIVMQDVGSLGFGRTLLARSSVDIQRRGDRLFGRLCWRISMLPLGR